MTPQKLRNSILQLAIEGKLTEQKAEDGNAADLLKEIQAEKAKLVKEKKIKKEKPLPEITEEEIPFEVPENWCWVRLGNLGLTITGKTPNTSTMKYYNGNFPFIGPGNVKLNGIIDYNTEKKLTEVGLLESRALSEGDIIQVCIGGSIGKAALIKQSAGFNQQINALHPLLVSEKYILYVIISDFFIKNLKHNSTGTATPIINKQGWSMLLVPLPPLAEQKRIVARLEAILPHVDEYEKAYNELQELNAKFPAKLKNSLLQMAIEGKLTEQKAEDGNAAELLKEIKAEKAQLIKDKKIKKEKPLPAITEEEIPFEIPENWCWVRLGDISSYAQPKKKIKAVDISDNVWSLDLEDIEKDTGRVIKRVFTNERNITGEKVVFQKGDILYSKLRPYLKKILIAPDDGITSPELVPFRIYGNVYQRYFLWILKSSFVTDVVNGVSYGVKMPRVGTTTMINLIIPLPPLAEQKRIVTKLEQLLAQCDQLTN